MKCSPTVNEYYLTSTQTITQNKKPARHSRYRPVTLEDKAVRHLSPRIEGNLDNVRPHTTPKAHINTKGGSNITEKQNYFVYVPQRTCGGQKTALWNWLFYFYKDSGD